MSLLVIIWFASLVILLALYLLATLRLKKEGPLSSTHSFAGFRGFILEQFDVLLHHPLRVFHIAKPHTTRVFLSVIAVGRRSHDLFIERLFGRIRLEQGEASSFFLKYIAEHKQTRPKERTRGEGY